MLRRSLRTIQKVMKNSSISKTTNGTPVNQTLRIRELVSYFLRLGTLGFGGPVALCGLMEKELVQDRGWLTKQEMRDAIAISQSLPGPLAIQVGIFRFVSSGRLLGRLGRGMGLHPAQFLDSGRLSRSLCALRRTFLDDRHLFM